MVVINPRAMPYNRTIRLFRRSGNTHSENNMPAMQHIDNVEFRRRYSTV